MRKGYKHPVKETIVPNKTSSHPGERIVAFRGGKPKGALSEVTKIKQSIGVDKWQTIVDYVTGNGAERFVEELDRLETKEFIVGYIAVLEWVKPKLIRNNNINVNVDIDSISFE